MKKLSLFCMFCAVVMLLCTNISVFAQHTGGGGGFGASNNQEEQQEEPMTEDDASGILMQLLQILIYGGTPLQHI